MPAPIKTPLRAVIPLVTARLVAVTGVSANRVLLVARDAPKFQGDRDLLVRIGPPRPSPDFSPSVGRGQLHVLRTLQVTARTRRGVDLSDRHDYALLDEDAGHLALEESVLDALQTYMPEDEDGNWLLGCPVHWTPSAPPVTTGSVSQGWIESDLLFEIRYTLPVTDTGF